MKNVRHGLTTVLLMAGLILSGTANVFSGQIRGAAFGSYSVVVVVYGAVVGLVIGLVGLGVVAATGGITRLQLQIVFKVDGWRWSELGIWKYSALSGLSGVANTVTWVAAQPHLSPLVMSLMNQATVPFTVVVSMALMGVRYSAIELLCCTAVIACAAVSVVVDDSSSSGTDSNGTFWAIWAASTCVFAALASVLTEKAFAEYDTEYRKAVLLLDAEQPGGGSLLDDSAKDTTPPVLSIWLIDIVGSIVAVLTCVPAALACLWISFSALDLPTDQVVPTFRAGMPCLWQCDDGLSTFAADSATTLSESIFVLMLNRESSALLCFVCLKMTVPLVALLSPIDW